MRGRLKHKQKHCYFTAIKRIYTPIPCVTIWRAVDTDESFPAPDILCGLGSETPDADKDWAILEAGALFY